MLELGVFGGKYMTDCIEEFPAAWFEKARMYHERHDPGLNLFGVKCLLPLSEWRKRGWIYHEDPRGWFQWYCRCSMEEDARTMNVRSEGGGRYGDMLPRSCTTVGRATLAAGGSRGRQYSIGHTTAEEFR